MLRDRLVVGVQDERIQRRLLLERDLKFQKACEVAQAMEWAAKNAEQLSASASVDVKPETLPVVVQNVNSQKPTLSSCYRCGYKGHVPSTCRFKSAICHGCKKMGHILRACKAKGKSGKQEHRAAVVEQEWELPEDGEQSQQYHHYMTQKVSKEEIVNSLESNQRPWFTPVMIEGEKLDIEIDTGASVSLISEAVYRQLCKKQRPALRNTVIVLKTYTGEKFLLLGRIIVKASTPQARKGVELPLLLVKGSGPSWFGRD